MRGRNWWRRGGLLVVGLIIQVWAMAQDGTQGLNQANSMVRGYFPAAVDLMFGIGAILGIVGAIKVFSMMIRGDERTGHTAAIWFGACIFLVVIATVIKSFFGL
jgi:Domain of unknown function (DUF4134)